eukprot:1144128-Pelagomonas_calceolata.AAC.4
MSQGVLPSPLPPSWASICAERVLQLTLSIFFWLPMMMRSPSRGMTGVPPSSATFLDLKMLSLTITRVDTMPVGYTQYCKKKVLGKGVRL